MTTQRALVAALLLAGVAQFVMASQDDTIGQMWSEWKTKHNKQYETPEEDARRFTVFQDNKKFVDEHNAKFYKGDVTYFMGLNPFSDLTNEEFRLRNGHGLQVLPVDAQWSEWKATHNKQYESAVEERRRYAVFLDNKKHVEDHNAKFSKGEVTYSLGLNDFSDLTKEEFKQRNTHGGVHKKALQQQWAEWKATHNKQYETPAEEARRFALFQETKKQVDDHNEKFKKGEVTFSMGLNAFSDLTVDELKQHNGHGVPKKALHQQWFEWKSEHNKQYESPEEEGRRFALFQETKKRIDEHNEKFEKGEVSFSMGLNSFSDLTSEEMKQRFGHGVLTPKKN